MSSENPSEKFLNALLQESNLPFRKSKEEAFESIKQRITAEEAVIVPFPKQFKFVKVAASIAVILALSITAILLAEKEVGSNQNIPVSHILPDGSEVLLNKGASLSYNSLLWLYNRNITMDKGEVFYEVTKGSDFTVYTPYGEVAVLGTSFNISLENQSLSVACKTGKVKVKADSDTLSATLTPGESVTWTGQEWNEADLSLSEIGAWTKPILLFEDSQLEDVFKRLELETGYTFILNGDMTGIYSGQIVLNSPISEMLNIICLPMNLTYTIEAEKQKITITNQ